MRNKILIVLLIASLVVNSWMYGHIERTQLALHQTQIELSTTKVLMARTKLDLLVKRTSLATSEADLKKLGQAYKKLKKVKAKTITLSRGGDVDTPAPAPVPAPTPSINVVATAYTHTGDATRTGVMPHVGMIAVDPNFIPLGTRVHINGYGDFTATDTGGLIKGNKIDIFMDSEQECNDFGIRNLNLKILK